LDFYYSKEQQYAGQNGHIPLKVTGEQVIHELGWQLLPESAFAKREGEVHWLSSGEAAHSLEDLYCSIDQILCILWIRCASSLELTCEGSDTLERLFDSEGAPNQRHC
jgi:hypothetical protein